MELEQIFSNSNSLILLTILPLMIAFFKKNELKNQLFNLAAISIVLWAPTFQWVPVGLFLGLVSFILYIYQKKNVRDFLALRNFSIFIFLITVILTQFGFHEDGYSWKSWSVNSEGLFFKIFALGVSFLGIYTDPTLLEDRRRLYLVGFWPQLIILGTLSKLSFNAPFGYIYFLVSATFSFGAFFKGNIEQRFGRLQNAVYFFALGALTSSGLNYSLTIFLSFSTLLLLGGVLIEEVGFKFNKAIWILFAAIVGFPGFQGVGFISMLLSVFLENLAALVCLVVALLLFQASFIKVYMDRVKILNSDSLGTAKVGGALFLSALSQLGILSLGLWSGGLFSDVSDRVWKGFYNYLLDPTRSVEIFGLQYGAVALAIIIGVIVKNKNPAVMPFLNWIESKKGIREGLSNQSQISLETVLVKVENLGEVFGKFGETPGRAMQVVLNGNLQRNVILWLGGLLVLYIHCFRS